MRCYLLALSVPLIALPALDARAQVIRDSTVQDTTARVARTYVQLDSAKRAQVDFEIFRAEHSPGVGPWGPPKAGQFAYSNTVRGNPPPVEPATIAARRDTFISLLDAMAAQNPGDPWIAEQRVRYLTEAGYLPRALEAAHACRATEWLCDALVGFSLHTLQRYPEADSVFALALASMSMRQRCAWRDLGGLIDDDTQREYARLTCGDTERTAFEDRVWYVARTLYSTPSNDSRTEHYARKTMEIMIRDAPHALASKAVRDHFIGQQMSGDWTDVAVERLLRYGWMRGLEFSYSRVGIPLIEIGGGFEARAFGPVPSYRYIPSNAALGDPARSDSVAWNDIHVLDIAAYAPPYAVSFAPLAHQSAMFKRGDSALVVVAYQTTSPALKGGSLTSALVLSAGSRPTAYSTVVSPASDSGVLMAKAPWGPLLMNAEVYALDRKALARARYGMQPPPAIGTRVTLSDLLLFKPVARLPASVEEAALSALTSARVMANEKLGVYWEEYGTDPAGEKMQISLTVVSEQSGTRNPIVRALRLARERTPVVVSAEDISARGQNATHRALGVDISTLTKGTYIVQLEVEVAGQYTVRSERRITVVGP
jgi:hypothetical protein